MQQLLELIFKSIPKDAEPITIFLFIILISFVFSLFRANIIYDFFEKLNNREFSRLKGLLTDPNISEKAKKVVRGKIDSIAYKNATKITTDIHIQEKIINYYELADGRLSYSDFKNALSFLKIDREGILYVREINILDYLFWTYFLGLSILSGIFICLIWLALLFASISIITQALLILLIINFGVTAWLFISQASLLPAAKRIRKEIYDNPLIPKSKEARIKQKQNIFSRVFLKKKKLRPYGLCEGEFTVPDDFDDPLPEDILNSFEGK